MNALLATLSCVYSEMMFTIISFFQKLIKGGGVGIRAGGGGLENFSQINKRGGGERLFGTREYTTCTGLTLSKFVILAHFGQSFSLIW